MHSRLTVLTAVGLPRTGVSASAISSRLGLPRATVRDRLSGSIPHSARTGACARCRAEHRVDRLAGDYAYLLGLDLGDGCISDRRQSHPRSSATLNASARLRASSFCITEERWLRTVPGER
jgi:hypothetical protein